MPKGGKRSNAGRPPKWGTHKLKKKNIIAELDDVVEALCNLYHATKVKSTALKLAVEYEEQQRNESYGDEIQRAQIHPSKTS
jgi:hypothetical protein